MKYLVAVFVFLSLITLILFTTPASQAGSNVFINVGVPGSVYVSRPGYNCWNGFCNGAGFGPGYYRPGFYPPVATTPVTVYPVLLNDTGAFDNIYGPGASPARRLAPYRNTNIYHGW